jgi:sugar O-acyltransferase (sialic acid O-acetyltransferase NeuD family)
MQVLRVPLLNANEDEVDVVDVRVQEGSNVRTGDVLFLVESTKATLDVEAPSSGYVRNLRVEKGQRAKVNSLLCVLTSSPDEPVVVSDVALNEERPFRITRKAQELAERHHLDVSSLGLTGIIKESDVERLLRTHPMTSEVAARKRERLPVPPGAGEPVLVYGARGHARVLIDLMRLAGELFPVAAVDDSPADAEVLGVPVVGNSSLFAQLRADGIDRAVLGIGSVHNHQARAKLYHRLVAAGFTIPNLIHPRAMVEPSAVTGVGNQIFAGAVVGSATKIGDNTIINSGTVVSHDCVIASHTHLSPGAILAGGVEVGENTLVGMGVTVYLGVRIGNNVVIANGSHIMKDVPDGSVMRSGSPPPRGSSA